MLRIVIPGPPISKARPRLSVRGRFANVYDSQKILSTLKKKELDANLCHFQIETNLSQDEIKAYSSLPLSVSLEYHMPVPDSDSKAVKNAKLWGFELPSHKPDIDNLVKWTLDIANGILWADDAQIVHLTASQKYSETPCTIICVEAIKNTMNVSVNKVTKQFSPEELAEFDMSITLFRDCMQQYLTCDLFDKGFYFEAACEELVRFSNEYSPKIAKIAKAK